MLSINRILCPIDLTEETDSALNYAIALSRAFSAKLYFCHCIESFAEVHGREIFTRMIEDAILRQLSEAVEDHQPFEAVVVEGEPTTAISQAAAERKIDLIVMRSRRRPVAAALLGSTAEAVSRTAPCPVLIIHPNERDWIAETTHEINLKRILVAHDFSNDAEVALQYATSLAQEYQAELHLLHVLLYALAPALTSLPPSIEGDFQRATRQLHQALPTETSLWCEVKQAVLAGQPYREILSYAEENQIDLICMGVHGAGFSMRALFGSNADRVLRQAPCPVLIARPLKPAHVTI